MAAQAKGKSERNQRSYCGFSEQRPVVTYRALSYTGKVSDLDKGRQVAKTVIATLVRATPNDLVQNLWDLELTFDDDPGKVKKYTVRSKYPFKSSELLRLRLTLDGDEAIQVEPLHRPME